MAKIKRLVMREIPLRLISEENDLLLAGIAATGDTAINRFIVRLLTEYMPNQELITAQTNQIEALKANMATLERVLEEARVSCAVVVDRTYRPELLPYE